MAIKPPADEGALMSRPLRVGIIGYLLVLGVFFIYALLRLTALDFPDVTLVIEAPQSSGGVQTPPTPPPATPPPPGGQPPGDPVKPSPGRPILIDAFPHLRRDPTPVYHLALYGSGFVEKSQVRLNGTERAPRTTPRDDLIQVVPMPGDFANAGALIVEVVNPDRAISNSLALKIDRPRMQLRLLTLEWSVTREVQLMLMVLFAGALGGLVHAVKSLADYIGNRTAVTSWAWYYLTRPFLGGTLAFIVYAVLRGGFLTGTAGEVRVVSPFGAIALAALAGMFADKAAQKLAEVFDTLFKTDDRRGGKLAAPVVDRLEPPTVRTGTKTAVDLKIIGDRLGATRTVKIEGKERTPDKVGDKEVVVKIQPEELAKSGRLSIGVVTADASSPSLTLHVSDVEIAAASLPQGRVDTDYPATTLVATGGTAPYRWSMQGAPGLKIDPSGAITGKPTKAGDAKVVVTVTDSTGASDPLELPLHIVA
jgi:hypothetical protein